MVKKTLRVWMVLAVCCVSTGVVQARDLVKNLQLDTFVLGGASTIVDAQYWNDAGRLYHSRLDMGPKYTIGVAAPYGKLLSIETAFTSGPNNLYVSNTNAFPHKEVEYPVRDYIGSVSAVVHAPFAFMHLRPYGVGGVEYDRFSPTPAAISTAKSGGFGAVSTATITHNDKFGLNFGVGVDRKLSKRLTFRIDLRDHVTSPPAFGLPHEATYDSAAIFPVAGRANNIVYTAGIVLHLGKL
jgi:opacity protein-like surface antigen